MSLIKISPNDKLIYEYLKKKGFTKRRQICDELQIPWSSAYDSLARLILKGKVVKRKCKVSYSRPGAPSICFGLRGVKNGC